MKGKRHQPVISAKPSAIVLDWDDDTIVVTVLMQQAQFLVEVIHRKHLLMADPASITTIVDTAEAIRKAQS